MHAKVELSYAASDRIQKMHRAEREQLIRLLPTLEVPLDEEMPAKWSIPWDQRDFTIDLSDIGPKLVDLGLSFEVKRFASCYRVAEPGAAGPGTTNNIQIAIPNLLLFAVDEVKLLDDACTDLLQSHLDEGWRILAICPPPAQRRPDYIIGRQKERA